MIQQPGTNIFYQVPICFLKVVLHSTGLYAVRLPAARKKLTQRQKNEALFGGKITDSNLRGFSGFLFDFSLF
ncbi:hypothetical protein [Chitinophaga sp. 22620]|uniref:hypothetical protein n=1 Tax=Chitinophaga sp. 22620 TaxID=3453952 RepID=UPI003F825FE7